MFDTFQSLDLFFASKWLALELCFFIIVKAASQYYSAVQIDDVMANCKG